jgi:hypothetical protein
VVTLALAAGTYLLQANLTATAGDGIAHQVFCQVNPTGSPVILAEGDSQLNPGAGTEFASIAFNTVTTLAAAGTVALNCVNSPAGTTVNLEHGTLIATMLTTNAFHDSGGSNTLTLAAGTYLIQASVTATAGDGIAHQVFCQVNPAGSPVILGEGDSQLNPGAGTEFTSIAFNTVTTLAADGAVVLNCVNSPAGTTINLEHIELIATPTQ